jgi:hypothetical protein
MNPLPRITVAFTQLQSQAPDAIHIGSFRDIEL